MKAIITLILLVITLSVPRAYAQCSTGVDTGGQCIPPEILQPQGNRNQQENPQRLPRAIWSDRWGAIARDENSGDAGTIEGQDSKDKANQIAMGICERNGSKHCQIVLSFYNQCAAVALGGKIINASGGATPQLAEENALSRCGGQSEQCKIVYSACSLPVRIQ